jgi:thioredoxin-like negative regulator of GroEL
MSSSTRPPAPLNFESTLQNEEDVLYSLLELQAHSALDEASWEELTRAALRDDRASEVAFAFESIAQGKRIKAYAPTAVSEFLYRAALFFHEALSDDYGARGYLERAVQAYPAHEKAFTRLAGELNRAEEYRKLAELYLVVGKAMPRENASAFFRQAGDLWLSLGGEEEKAIAAYQEVLRVDPADEPGRRALEDLLERAGRYRDLAKVIEQGLTSSAPPDETDALLLHARLVSLYAEKLQEPALALPHVEAVLATDPENAEARRLAESLLGVRNFAARAAGALANAAQALGQQDELNRYLGIELEHTRGPKRRDLLKRLGVLRRDHHGDLRGALEAFEGALLLEPGDDETRAQYRFLAERLGTQLDAARTLIRVAPSVKEPAARARISVDTGELLALSGDKRRARVTLAGVLTMQGADEPTLLAAARALAKLAEEENDGKLRLEMLERVVSLERDPALREDATLTLADLATRAGDRARAAFAWKKLVGTHHRDRALAELQPIFEEQGDAEELVFVLEERSKSALSEDDARPLAFRAAQLLGSTLNDDARARTAWTAFVERFGPARDVIDQLAPVLERARDWDALAALWADDIELAPPEQRPALYARLGAFHLQRTRRAEDAFGAFAEALSLDATEPSTRQTVEGLLQVAEHRLAAARLLESFLRDDQDGHGLLRVLEIRAADETDASARLAALSEAADIAERDAEPRFVEYCTRALGEAALLNRNVPYWQKRTERAMDDLGLPPKQQADLLAQALQGKPPTTPELADLVRRTAEFYEAADAKVEAVAQYRLLLAAQPDSQALLARIDELLSELGDPAERARLYEETIAREGESARAREFLIRLGVLCRDELRDNRRAVAAFRAAYERDAHDAEAFELLAQLLRTTRSFDALRDLLVQHVANGPTAAARGARIELVQVAHRTKKRDLVLEHARAALDASPTPVELSQLEAIVRETQDAGLSRALLSAQLGFATDAASHVAAAEPLAALVAEAGDVAAATALLREAARVAIEDASDEDARRMLRRAIELDPEDDAARSALVTASERMGDLASLPVLLEALLLRADEPTYAQLSLRLTGILGEGLGRPQDAFAVLARAYARQPEQREVADELGRIAIAQRMYGAFRDATEATLAAARASANTKLAHAVLLSRCRVAVESGAAYMDASSALRAALEADLPHADSNAVTALFGELLTWESAPSDARIADRRWLRARALAARVGPERIPVLLAWAHEEEADDEHIALERYRDVLAIDAEHPDALAEVARLTARAGDVDAALTALETLRARAQGADRVSLDVDVATLLLDPKGDAPRALDVLRGAVELAPADPRVVALLRRLFALDAVRSQAVSLVERAAQGAADAGDHETELSLLDLLLEETPPTGEPSRAKLHAARLARLVSGDDRPRELRACLAAAQEFPAQSEFWDHAEQVARALSEPNAVAAAFDAVLNDNTSTAGRPVGRDVFMELGRRAVEFQEEWFEDSARKVKLLDRLFDHNPQDHWAFDRLRLVFDAEERWSELFDLYDRAIARSADSAKASLLEDAAHVAKDFAKDTERAIAYFEAFTELSPGKRNIENALERLYEKTGRHASLIRLYRSQLPQAKGDAARALKVTIAKLYLDGLRDAPPSWSFLDELALEGFTTDVVALMERSLEVARPTDQVDGKAFRQLVAERLRAHYEVTGARGDLARMLEVLLEPLDDASALRASRRSLADVYLELNQDEAAFRQLRELVLLSPGDRTLRDELRDVGGRIHRHDVFAETLDSAAAAAASSGELAAELWFAAASAYKSLLGADALAAERLAHVFSVEGATHAVRLAAARELVPLLETLGRASELLSTLELLATLEDDDNLRRAALARAARMAEAQGDRDRAIRAWEARVAQDPKDREALDALVELYDAVARNEELVQTLRARASLGKKTSAARADRLRAATVLRERLERPRESIEEWLALERTFGETVDTKAALAGLYAEVGEHSAAAESLEVAAKLAKGEQRASLRAELGDTYRLHLGAAHEALASYEASLRIVAAQPRARAGLLAMIEGSFDASVVSIAVEQLLAASERTDDHALRLQLTEHRFSLAKDDAERVRILMDAAVTAEQRAGEFARAYGYVERAFRLSPWGPEVEAALLHLARRAQAIAPAVAAMEDVLERFADHEPKSGWQQRTRMALGEFLEHDLHEDARALTAYGQVAREMPEDERAALATIRVAARRGDLDRIAEVLVSAEALLGARAEAAEATFVDTRQVRELCLAFFRRLQRGDLGPTLLAQGETQLARWLRDRADDKKGAEESFVRALQLAPTDVGLLRELADVQRSLGGRALVETLLALSAATGGDLALLREAGEAALETEDVDLSRATLGALYQFAEEAWVVRQDVRGESYLRWAREARVELALRQGQAEEAYDLLLAGVALPHKGDERRILAERAAELALDRLASVDRAIAVLLRALQDYPRDANLLLRLGSLYEERGLLERLVELRRHELRHAESDEERAAARLALGDALERAGDRAGAAHVLLETFNHQPRHEATVASLTRIYRGSQEFAQLEGLLFEQGVLAEKSGDLVAAASLFVQAARVAEEDLQQVPLAIKRMERAATLMPRPEYIDHLARLASLGGMFALAADQLERLRSLVSSEERPAVVLRLARALVETAQHDLAVERLVEVIAEVPAHMAARDELARLYRERGDEDALASLLEASHPYAPRERVLPILREASELFVQRVRLPARAVPLLEQARALDAADRGLMLLHADALGQAGDFDGARAILRDVLDGFGGRKPKERASVHYYLARLHLAAGDRTQGASELETATKIDPTHAQALHLLANTSRGEGRLERAERAYRALLTILRRAQEGEASQTVAKSEVLLDLSELAQEQGDPERAKEILESAFEAAQESPLEAERLERRLRARGQQDVRTLERSMSRPSEAPRASLRPGVTGAPGAPGATGTTERPQRLSLAPGEVVIRTREAADNELLVRALATRLTRFGDNRGQVVFELASLLFDALGRAEEAWPHALAALTAAPTARGVFELCEAIARASARVAEFTQSLRLIAADFEDAGDRATAAELFARAAELTAQTDPNAALRILERIKELGASSDRILSLLDNLYGRLGYEAEQLDILETRVASTSDAEVRRQGLYRLAERRLANPESRELGVDNLAEAVDGDARPVRARDLLKRITDGQDAGPRLLKLWEDVARRIGDPLDLADALEKAWRVDVTELSPLEEATRVLRATDGDGTDGPAAAERLLRRALQTVTDDNPKARGWILRQRADLARQRGDEAAARDLTREAARFADAEDRRETLLGVASAAAAQGDDDTAIDVYVELFDEDPTDARVFEPLAGIYRRQERKDRLADLLSTAAEHESSPERRASLRFERATLMLQAGRPADILVPVLQEILEDDPARTDVALRLAELLEQTGQREELDALYVRMFETARLAKQTDAAVDYGVRLTRLRDAEGRADDAGRSLREALELAPDAEGLLELLVALGRKNPEAIDRSEALERLIRVRRGADAAQLTLELAQVREGQWDDPGVERALELGLRSAPESDEIRRRLESLYRDRGAWFKLVDLFVDECAHVATPQAKVELLRKAAGLCAETLREPRRAANLLRDALAVTPEDTALLEELVAALAAGGDVQGALQELSRVLDSLPEDARGARAALLQRRGVLQEGQGDHGAAAADFDLALQVGADTSAQLQAALYRHRQDLLGRGEAAAVRVVDLRLADLLIQGGNDAAAMGLIGELMDRDPTDREALLLYAWLAERAGQVDQALDVYHRLTEIASGPELVDIATRFADVAERLGQPQQSRAALERVRAEIPEERAARQRLLRLYDEAQEYGTLAPLCLELAALSTDAEEQFQYLVRAGTVLLDLGGDAESAQRPLEEALALKPSDLDVVALLADAYTATGRAREAAEVLTRTIASYRGKRSRELGTLHHRLARVAQLDGDRIGEVQSLTTALDMDPQNGYAASELAAAAMDLGQWEVANRALRAITMLKGDAPMSKAVAYKHLGEIAYQQGDSKRAVVMLKRAVDEDPSLEEARALLQQIQ